MTTNELHEKVVSWLWAHTHTPFPPSTDPKFIQFNDLVCRKWASEMFTEITSWELPLELIGTPIEQDIQLAISYARMADLGKVIKIHDLLVKISTYIADNHLASGKIHSN